jgi:hypothetical protein
MRTRTFAPTLALLLLLPAGCSLLPFGGHGGGSSEDVQEEVVSLHASNHNWSNIVVFATRGSSYVRLGDLTTGQEADFVVPRSLVVGGQVTFVLHPIGGPRDFSTGPILVQPGQEINLRIENALPQTSWSVS